MTMTKNPPKTDVKNKQGFHLDKDAIRAAAKKIDDGAVTEGYRGNREEVVAMLNDALATELLCVMRYKRHYYTAKGLNVEAIKGEFLAHAQEEQSHADQIAERIVQLNGEPDFNPKTIAERSHAQYDESEDIKDMIRANLVEERVAIEAYRQMIERIGDDDPTTKHLLIQIMAQEEEHADDMSDLLGL
ncbi:MULTISPECIES: ferritin-like domain-containing protein [Herbaspirillum]|jgi:bacterioferritin|uniref:Bacterioferritin n=1 Tax=Herbaspirillum aquaticum TaxID=568783 RepID=A0A225SS10_9BURK|nr:MULTISPECIES: ferritin-like domain-containing protein [Herbaspirillum]MBW9336645.1 ferritin-like domain-containing protein [Herbaspirillum sp. RU 5E]MRT27707.1 ferritin-like domain-containing protein [Herbaspirillum sp. CAH-3]OWY32122.1 bacterioferritin [Herbaspirillum aquaticum]